MDKACQSIYSFIQSQGFKLYGSNFELKDEYYLACNQFVIEIKKREVAILNMQERELKNRKIMYVVYASKNFRFEYMIHKNMKSGVTVDLIKNIKQGFGSEFIYMEKKLGYVYIIQAPFAYKIGQTSQLDKRIKTFGIKLPFELTLTIKILTKEYVELEKILHEMFKEKRMDGEWFKLNDDDINTIVDYAKSKKLTVVNSNIKIK